MTIKPTLAIDFDGTINSYTSGWNGDWTIIDPPVPGAIDALNEYSKHFHVVIFTTRAATREGQTLIGEWLVQHGFTGGVLDITNVKPPAKVLIDDRAITFTGRWPEVEELQSFEPWTKKPPRQSYLTMLEEALMKYREQRLALEAFLRAEFPIPYTDFYPSTELAMHLLRAYKADHGLPRQWSPEPAATASESQPDAKQEASNGD